MIFFLVPFMLWVRPPMLMGSLCSTSQPCRLHWPLTKLNLELQSAPRSALRACAAQTAPGPPGRRCRGSERPRAGRRDFNDSLALNPAHPLDLSSCTGSCFISARSHSSSNPENPELSCQLKANGTFLHSAGCPSERPKIGARHTAGPSLGPPPTCEP